MTICSNKHMNIAIDGPAGAGKSTVAKALAKQLNIIYLDTGAMYRGVAWLALKKGVAVDDEKSVNQLLSGLKMDIVCGSVQQIIVNGENCTPYIREHAISKAASDISRLTPVRLKMVELQREIAAENDVVLDGRDIGSYVLPNAQYKFFITAEPEVRAKRRHLELVEKGNQITLNEVLKDIRERDYNDSHRALAPLVVAEGAQVIDTTDMDINEVLKAVLSRINRE